MNENEFDETEKLVERLLSFVCEGIYLGTINAKRTDEMLAFEFGALVARRVSAEEFLNVRSYILALLQVDAAREAFFEPLRKADELGRKRDDEILNGKGAGQPLGILNAKGHTRNAKGEKT